MTNVLYVGGGQNKFENEPNVTVVRLTERCMDIDWMLNA